MEPTLEMSMASFTASDSSDFLRFPPSSCWSSTFRLRWKEKRAFCWISEADKEAKDNYLFIFVFRPKLKIEHNITSLSMLV